MYSLTVLVLCVSLVFSTKLPNGIKTCKKTDPDVNQCLGKATEEAMYILKHGVPDIKYPQIEPLNVPSLIIGEGTGPVNVKQHFTDLNIHGLVGSKVISFKFDFDKNVIHVDSFTSKLYLEGDYSMNGRILLLPIQGNGKCNITLVNTTIKHILEGTIIEKNGGKYLKILNFLVTLKPERVYFQFDNLFNGDPLLGPELNRILNENWSEIFEDVRGGYEKSLGIIFKSLSNKLFSKVPYNNIFIE